MNTIAYPNSVRANIAKYNLINFRANKVVKRNCQLTRNEAKSINTGYISNISDLILVAAK